MTPNNIFMIWFFCLVAVLLLASGTNAAGGGSWAVVQPNIGISAMHMQLLPTDRVVMFDRTDFGASNLSLPAGKCRSNPPDCTAHSIEYDVLANTFRPLMVQTNVWCSSGALMPDGRLIQTGGFQDGEHVVRVYKSCDTCDWREVQSGLTQKRWYATNHLLPGGRQIIIGGRRQFNYEFYPKTATADKSYSLPFLVQTNDPQVENNLYPFVFLNVDGNLFVFANNRAILFDYSQNAVLKTYPQIPGGDPRSYPSTGSAVLLPLKNIQSTQVEAEVLVCGGAPKGSYTNSLNGKFDGALNTCARIKVTDPAPQWVVETMPLARVMGDMLLLPTGDVLIINGASAGAAGWEQGRNPVLSPVLYQPDNTVGARFEVQNPTAIPRMYHSTAGLLRDGRVLVAGSNPHAFYNFTGVLYPTELSLEAFSPKYLDSTSDNLRPKIISPRSRSKLKYGQQFNVRFSVAASGTPDASSISVTMVSPAFNTHSFSMNQRLLVVSGGDAIKKGKSGGYDVRVTMPSSANFAPPGYYMLFVVHQGVPSQGIWIHIN